jgi:hypothetical protein
MLFPRDLVGREMMESSGLVAASGYVRETERREDD